MAENAGQQPRQISYQLTLDVKSAQPESEQQMTDTKTNERTRVPNCRTWFVLKYAKVIKPGKEYDDGEHRMNGQGICTLLRRAMRSWRHGAKPGKKTRRVSSTGWSKRKDREREG